MDRVVAAFRLLPRETRPVGPFVPSADGDLEPAAIGIFLDACYVAGEKLREFGLSDRDFGGPIKLVTREDDELANGRYIPKTDSIFIFHPYVRGVPDMPWTIIHEVGHRIWHQALNDDQRDMWKLITCGVGATIPKIAADAMAQMAAERPLKFPLWFFFQKRFGSDIEAFRDWLRTRPFSKSFPTDYSVSEPAEAFADVFAETVLGRGHAGAALRRTGAFVKKSFASLVEPYRASIYEELLLEQQDESFLQSQIDLPSLDRLVSNWVEKNISGAMLEKLPRRPHVTLVYGLDKVDSKQIRETAENFGRPIRVLPGKLNFFDAPSYDVLYLEAISPAISNLRRELLRLPHTRPQSHGAYTPHITVAYLKKGTARRFVGNSPLKLIVTRPGFSLIDAAGVETFVPTVSADDPLLLASECTSEAAIGSPS